jgi:cyclophilin family peptidyl-prolyl cis-trans isomerase
MALYAIPWKRALTCLVLMGLLMVGTVSGCNRSKSEPQGEDNDQGVQVTEDDKKPKQAPVDPRFRQSFAEATRADPPAESRPPDMTMTGKSTGKLYTEVKRLWDSIPLVGEDGKPLAYRAVLETKLGNIEIDLNVDLAPNHVRNFIALARAGYYDGLVFERLVHQESEVRPTTRLDLVEAGNPTGLDDEGLSSFGSIGYWLKPEFNAEAVHEEGTVGACHGQEADTAACRFYVTLCKAPAMNGNWTVFGKVTKGLDVVRTIATQPAKEEEQDLEGSGRPLQPVVIDKVTIVVAK